MVIVTLAGLLRLLLTSRKPEAERFQRWVTHEVLPEIMRTGTYSVGPRQSELERITRRVRLDHGGPGTDEMRCPLNGHLGRATTRCLPCRARSIC
jgi:prophage antirepressor-like protein